MLLNPSPNASHRACPQLRVPAGGVGGTTTRLPPPPKKNERAHGVEPGEWANREPASAQGARKGRKGQRGKQETVSTNKGRGNRAGRRGGKVPEGRGNARCRAQCYVPCATRAHATSCRNQSPSPNMLCTVPLRTQGRKGSEVAHVASHRVRPHRHPHQGKTA